LSFTLPLSRLGKADASIALLSLLHHFSPKAIIVGFLAEGDPLLSFHLSPPLGRSLGFLSPLEPKVIDRSSAFTRSVVHESAREIARLSRFRSCAEKEPFEPRRRRILFLSAAKLGKKMHSTKGKTPLFCYNFLAI